MPFDLLKFIPKNAVSRVAGLLADAKVPPCLLHSFIDKYGSFYGVNFEEMEKDLEEYLTFNEFFSRGLKEGVRSIDSNEHSVVSPCDGKISEFGKIDNESMIQAKGIEYTLSEFIGSMNAKYYKDGYYITIYLAPGDYHRFHSPLDCSAEAISYFSGNLWPVNEKYASALPNLFCINERVFTRFSYQDGLSLGVVCVGAMIVGSVSLDYYDLRTNYSEPELINFPISEKPKLAKGDQLGTFKLGSTIVLLFSKDSFIPSPKLARGSKVLFGEAIGTNNVS